MFVIIENFDFINLSNLIIFFLTWAFGCGTWYPVILSVGFVYIPEGICGKLTS